ncbi:MAG TPA: hypothetical protein VNG13_01095 [Mycobacteriales bacterium]|nr:hypothetical protein [Mycobacteriales bacterium]
MSTRSLDLTADLARDLVATAVRAPSLHNSQPWQFRLDDGGIELRGDPSRLLPVADPSGRELAISCGAALMNLRLAARSHGMSTHVALVPDPAEPALFARVAVTAGPAATDEERRLLAAVARRHTHRGRFSERRVAPELMVALMDAVALEGAHLFVVGSPGRARRLADLVAAAERTQRADPTWRDELLSWTPAPAEDRRDGVPAAAYSSHVVASPNSLVGRDFDLGRGWGRLPGAGPEEAVLAVLATDGDSLEDWLSAGQAVQRMLLRAACDWAFAAIFSQPLELRYVRHLVAEELSTPNDPQMLLRIGHADGAAATPRRPVSEVFRAD